MKRFLPLLFFVSFFISCSKNDLQCDGGTFTGHVVLLSQQEVNEFTSNCYTKIEGSLLIGTSGNGNNDITDLTGFTPLTEVFPGRIYIESYELTNLDGLQNVTKVGGLGLSSCFLLENIRGLSGLQSIGNFDDPLAMPTTVEDLTISNCISLTSLDGLQNLTRAKNVRIAGNPLLTSLDGLENLSELANPPASSDAYGYFGYLNIGWFPCLGPCHINENLTDVCALQNLLSNGIYDADKVTVKVWQQNNPISIADITNGDCAF